VLVKKRECFSEQITFQISDFRIQFIITSHSSAFSRFDMLIRLNGMVLYINIDKYNADSIESHPLEQTQSISLVKLSLFGRDWPLFDSGQPDLRMPG
jgi:hypothetical protein